MARSRPRARFLTRSRALLRSSGTGGGGGGSGATGTGAAGAGTGGRTGAGGGAAASGAGGGGVGTASGSFFGAGLGAGSASSRGSGSARRRALGGTVVGMAPVRPATRLRTGARRPSLPFSKAMPITRPWAASRWITVPSSSSVGHLGSLASFTSIRACPGGIRFGPMCILRWVLTSIARSTRTKMPVSEMFSRVPVMPTPSKSPVRAVTVAPSRALMRARGRRRRSARTISEGSSTVADPCLVSSSLVAILKRRPSSTSIREREAPLSTVRAPWGERTTLSSITDTRVAGTSRSRASTRSSGARTRWASSR